MDSDIKKSSMPLTQSDYESLLEYKAIGTQKPDIIDERASLDGFDDVRKRAELYRTDRINNRIPYPWEEEEVSYINYASTQDPKPYVKKTYYVNGHFSSDPNTETIIESFDEKGVSKKRVVVKNKNIVRIIAKLKGNRTVFVNSIDANSYTLGNLSPLPSAPPADPRKKAQEIAELKADPRYKFWNYQITKNGGDGWLSAVYDECVQIRCVFWHLIFVMAFESGLSPIAKNPKSSGAGLIQWMNYGIFRKHGFSNPRAANAFQQLPFITKYYQGRGGWKERGVPNLVAAYTYVAGGNTADPNAVIYTKTKNPRVLLLNPLWDLDKDGRATAGEMTLSVLRRWYGVKDNSWINKYPNGIWRKEPIIFKIRGLRR